MSTPDPTPTPLPAAPTPEAAAAMGAQGGPPSEAERLAFEAWMRGHSWPVASVWNGTTYIGSTDLEPLWLDTAAMQTRMLWAAWRDRAALATPPAPPLEPRGCPLPGACSCPTAPIVPPELIRALELADEALTDPCLELSLRVIHQVTHIRQALQTWRDHATPPAATREAGPLPREEAEISDEELADVASAAGLAWETWEDGLFIFARAVLARWGGAAVSATADWDRAQALEERFERWWYDEGSVPPSEGRDWEEHVHHMTRIAWHNGAFVAAGPAVAVQPVALDKRPWERPGWCDAEGRCWFGAERDNGIDSVWVLRRPAERMSYQRWCVPHWALPVPAADAGEGQP